MLNCSDEQSQETDGDHCQAKSMRSDDASAFRRPCPRDTKELLDCEAERDQRGGRPDPRQERALIGEARTINSEIGLSAGFRCSFTAIIHAVWATVLDDGATAMIARLSASLHD